MMKRVHSVCLIVGVTSLLAVGRPAFAEDPTFAIEFKDGTVTPTRIEVPAKARFKLELKNSGKTAAEFETRSPKFEKVIAAGAKSSLVIRTLDPGEYEFFDDFHPQAKGTLVAK
ncbi:MAG: cupredoxin domain-containing protein [Methylobacteriaceae bacterium]|nr:cupredoxin domain-containing protein [Methylobacteriaceae bacterium]